MTPLESFFLSYLNSEELPWEKVEPQVYDALLKGDMLNQGSKSDLVRFCFDPLALSEHPGSRLMALGDPSLDEFFQKIIASGRASRIFLSETPSHQNPEGAIRKALTLPSTATFGKPRPLYFSKALFYFQITYLSDEKQQMLLSVGVDLYFGRIARHLENLVASSEILSSRPLPYPDAGSIAPEDAYVIAWNECSGKAKAGTSLLKQNLEAIFSKETLRLKEYFSKLKEELLERQQKTKLRGEECSKFSEQLKAIDLEEKARFLDLQKKNALQTDIRLVSVLWLNHIQLLTPITVQDTPIEVVWDPKMHRVEPIACPSCQSPTLQLSFVKRQLCCPQCLKKS